MSHMARIVVVGVPDVDGLRDSLVTAFRHLGCAVDLLDLGPWSPSWLVSAAFRQPIFGIGFRRDFRRRVDALAGNGSTDLVLVVKGALLDAPSIDHLRSRFVSPVACWNPDSPFDGALSNCGAGIPRTIGAYDAYITWADDVAERLSEVASRVLVIPFAWDPEIMRPTAGHGVAKGRIIFIGTGTRERSAWLQSLASLRPVVFGNRWPEIEGVDIRPPIKGVEFCKIAGEAKWNLNILRPQNARSHNMRTFELVGAGANQIAPLTDDHQKFLSGDSRTLLFQDKDELRSILQSDPCDRPARLPAVLDGHTYADRARQLLADLRIL